MKHFLLHGAISFGLLATAPARTWTSVDGRTLEGDLKRVEGEVAVLKVRAQVNVVGGFFSCCSKSMVRTASQEAKVRSTDWCKIKAFQSTGDKDLLVKPAQIKSVSEDLKRNGVKKIVSKTFPGTHNFHEEYLMEALTWFEKEEEK